VFPSFLGGIDCVWTPTALVGCMVRRGGGQVGGVLLLAFFSLDVIGVMVGSRGGYMPERMMWCLSQPRAFARGAVIWVSG